MEYIIRYIGLILPVGLLVIGPIDLAAQHDKLRVRSGNQAYASKDYDSALRAYDEALRINPKNQTALYNKADALYKAGKFDEAAEIFSQLANNETNEIRKAEALHNLGNSLLKTEKYQESVDAYRKSLRINPSDEQTRYNLAYALQKMKKQEEQNSSCDKPGENNKGDKNQEKKDGKDGKEGEQDPNEKGESKDKKEGEKNQNDSRENQPQDAKGEQDKSAQKPKPMSKQEAEMMLNALEKSEKDIQKKVLKSTQPGKKTPAEKDW